MTLAMALKTPTIGTGKVCCCISRAGVIVHLLRGLEQRRCRVPDVVLGAFESPCQLKQPPIQIRDDE